MGSLPEEFVIIDLEYTSWEGAQERDWSGPDEHREVVQIGAVQVHDLCEKDFFLEYVRPTINPVLSKYFVNLTHITQDDIDAKGIAFEAALSKLIRWIGDGQIYCMHGKDGDVLKENADLVQVPYPLQASQFRSAAEVFKLHGIEADAYMSSTILTAFGEKPLPHGHDALSDARSILRAFQLLFSRAI